MALVAILLAVTEVAGVLTLPDETGDPIAESSRRVGFDVKVPTYFPASDMQLAGVGVREGHSGFASVSLIGPIDGDEQSVVVRIDQFGYPVGRPPGSRLLDSGIPGAELYWTPGNYGPEPVRAYTLLTNDRTYEVIVGGPDKPSNAEIVRMLRSFPE